jgi:hypothetical protein
MDSVALNRRREKPGHGWWLHGLISEDTKSELLDP